MGFLYILNSWNCLGINGTSIFLNQMSEKGWNLVSGNRWFIKFEKGAAKRYEAVPAEFFDVTVSEANEKGWKYLFSAKNVSYFCQKEGNEIHPLLREDNLHITQNQMWRIIFAFLIPAMFIYAADSRSLNRVMFGVYCIIASIISAAFLAGAVMDNYDAAVLRATNHFKTFSSFVYIVLCILSLMAQVSWILLVVIYIIIYPLIH